jgi:two-component system, chemotaxis family, chemotaxis protein CheY
VSTLVNELHPRLLKIERHHFTSPQATCDWVQELSATEGPALGRAMPIALSKSDVEAMIQELSILLVDDNTYMRKIVRNLLINIGVRRVYEASDGIAGLDAIRIVTPDVVILDWELPLLNGAEFVRIVRSPGVFPMPDIPIIMLSAHGERWRVVEAVRIGVNEYLRKPVSAQALLDRLTSIVARPRPVVQLGDYYGPEPRKLVSDPVTELSIALAPGGTPLN